MIISDTERRRRLVRRHHHQRTASGCGAAVDGVAAFHSTDPVTPYLGMRARIGGFDAGHLADALWERRALWRMHAMRRTLFLVPTDEASTFLHGATADIARKERRRLERWLTATMDERKVGPWLAEAEKGVTGLLADGGEWRTQDLSKELPMLRLKLNVGSGRWTAETPVSSRLLSLMAMEGRLVRTRPAGSWRSSQYRWAATSAWFPFQPAEVDEAEARAQLAARYLAGHGPATAGDVRWWTGWRAGDTRRALADAGAVEVALENEATGYVLADDVAQEPPLDCPAVALLPGLDPTPMGWKERDWYVVSHGDELFDRAGNIGPSVWVDGCIVGGWAQRPDGTVVLEIFETADVDPDARDLLSEEAGSLEKWLDGQVASVRFPSPLQRRLAAA